MTRTEAEAVARTLVTARSSYESSIFEEVLSDTVTSLLAGCYCATEADRLAVQQRLAAVLHALASVADVALHAADEAIGLEPGRLRSRLFGKLAQREAGRGGGGVT